MFLYFPARQFIIAQCGLWLQPKRGFFMAKQYKLDNHVACGIIERMKILFSW